MTTIVSSQVTAQQAKAITDMATELERAKDLGFGDFRSAHEGFAILLEEVDELKAHVWMKQKNRDIQKMRKEAIEVAAMAIKFASVCDEEWGRI